MKIEKEGLDSLCDWLLDVTKKYKMISSEEYNIVYHGRDNVLITRKQPQTTVPNEVIEAKE